MTLAENGIDNVLELVGKPVPDVYSAGLSEFVFAAGVRLAETRQLDLMYLSTTDYVQHKCAPGTDGANAFYAMMDGYLARLDRTRRGDRPHRRPRHEREARPRDRRAERGLSAGLARRHARRARCARVILPITDPYVVHHGALGSFATDLSCRVRSMHKRSRRASQSCRAWKPCSTTRPHAQRFELPNDRVGDLVVVSGRDTVLGTRRAEHDLSGLDGAVALAWRYVRAGGAAAVQPPDRWLRVAGSQRKRLRNFDVFDIALNHLELQS